MNGNTSKRMFSEYYKPGIGKKLKLLFNMNYFMTNIIPSMLKTLQNYYIKGGKAYDAYFKNKTNSIDWDVVMNQETFDKLSKQLNEYAKIFSLTLMERKTNFQDETMIQFGFKDEFYDDSKDAYFLDAIIKDEKDITNNIATINGLNYMDLSLFVKDILETLSDRYDKVMKYMNSRENIQDNSTLKDFNLEYKQNMSYNYDSVAEFKNNTIFKLVHFIRSNSYNKKDKKKMAKKVYNLFYNNIIKPLQNIALENLGHKDQYLKVTSIFLEWEYQDDDSYNNLNETERIHFRSIYKYVETYFQDILSGFNQRLLAKLELKAIGSKYMKTIKRTQEVLNISTDTISEEYMEYLSGVCQNDKEKKFHYLYNLNKTCRASFTCKRKEIKKSISTCISEEENTKYSELMSKLKL